MSPRQLLPIRSKSGDDDLARTRLLSMECFLEAVLHFSAEASFSTAGNLNSCSKKLFTWSEKSKRRAHRLRRGKLIDGTERGFPWLGPGFWENLEKLWHILAESRWVALMSYWFAAKNCKLFLRTIGGKPADWELTLVRSEFEKLQVICVSRTVWFMCEDELITVMICWRIRFENSIAATPWPIFTRANAHTIARQMF